METWKSTEAAPTPIREGPIGSILALVPWQVAQLARNNCSPASTSSWVAVAAEVPGAALGAKAA